jgi:hypothetical protein
VGGWTTVIGAAYQRAIRIKAAEVAARGKKYTIPLGIGP